jgi:DNA-binding XRE family transcriptional regulator
MKHFEEAYNGLLAVRELREAKELGPREFYSKYLINLPEGMHCGVCGVCKPEPARWFYKYKRLVMCRSCWAVLPKMVTTFGIYSARKEAELSQAEVARRINVTRQRWRQIERSNKIHFHTALSIARELPWRPQLIICWEKHNATT